MLAVTATAPGKIILFGEHAVVCGRPAIAVPVTQVQAKVVVTPDYQGQAEQGPARQVHIFARDVGLDRALGDLAGDPPLALAVNGTLAAMGIERAPAVRLAISSTITIAAGLGSGAAI